MKESYPPDQPPVKGELSSTLYAFLDCLKNLTKQRGYCWPTNAFLAKQFKCTERTVTRRLSILVDEGHIRISYRNGERHIRIVPDHKPQKTKRGTAKKGEAAVIAPIETQYKGYRFRSRLEARWAVFYDELNLKWEYEKEGFAPDGKGYLPDFYLPDLDVWIEIKGQCPNQKEEALAEALAKTTDKTVYIFYGQIPNFKDEKYDYESARVYFPDGGGDLCHWWCACPYCGKLGIEFEARGERVCGDTENGVPNKCLEGKRLSPETRYQNNMRIESAYDVARSVRFEHGQSPTYQEPVEETLRRIIRQELGKPDNN